MYEKLKVLFVGGSGIISSASVALSKERGYEVSVLNRGNHPELLPEGVESIIADYKDEAACEKALEGKRFDVVADFRVFTADDMKKAIRQIGRAHV